MTRFLPALPSVPDWRPPPKDDLPDAESAPTRVFADARLRLDGADPAS